MKVLELKGALESVRPGLARKEFIEQTTSVIFRQDQVFTFNDEVAVVVPLKSGIIGAVPSDPLYKFLSKLPDDREVEIESAENEFRFSCGRSRAGIRRDEEIKLPLDEEISEPKDWTNLPKNFLPSLKRVLFSVAQGGHIPILTCVHITKSFMETCDGFRMTRCDCKIRGWETDINIVGKNLGKLPEYEVTKFGFSNNWLQFLNENGTRYCVRVIDGEYPDLSKFMEVEGVEIEFPEELEKALEWASIVADDSIKYKQCVEIGISKGKLVVKGEGPEGWAEETLRMRYTGEPIIFQTNPVLLKDMSSMTRKIIAGADSLKIEADGFVHIVSLGTEEE